MPPYASIPEDELTLRDELALDRTVLANERTLLSYLRTALALVAGAVALLQLVDATWATVMGIAALPLAAVISAIGIWRFVRTRRHLQAIGMS